MSRLDEIKARLAATPLSFWEIAPADIAWLLAEVERLQAYVASIPCESCGGSGRNWVGEDLDRPVACSSCNGTGHR